MQKLDVNDMTCFTGWQYLLIDAANNAGLGLDKQIFEARITWAETNLTGLEGLYETREWKEKPLFVKAVLAIRRAQLGLPIGHLVGFDAIGSGMQIMSALSGCFAGAAATGLVHDNVRSDPYTEITTVMSQDLLKDCSEDRKRVKLATVAGLYGSKKEPENLFGKDTPELEAFGKAVFKTAPGACDLLQDLLDSWQPYVLSHAWKLPDGYTAYIKVMQQVKQRLEVDELYHHKFDYTYYVNAGEESGVKNAANVIHSIDAYLLRSLVRRCNYDQRVIERACDDIGVELFARHLGSSDFPRKLPQCPELDYYKELFHYSKIADIVIVPHLNTVTVGCLTNEHLLALRRTLETMLEHKPFEVVTVHDDFRVHPNNVNALRKHYREILADLADSEILSDIFSQLHGSPIKFQKLSTNLGDTIRKSTYALS